MQNLLSLLFLIGPALAAMMLFIWVRQQTWIIKFSSVVILALVMVYSLHAYFPEKSLRERYAETILQT
jgi:membrane protein YdbS with pleckstrin-like domain